MTFDRVIRERYSVRSYQDKPVEDEKLNQILEAANLAPTAANRQPFRLIVLHTKGRKQELQRLYPRPWFVQAPIIIVALAVMDEGWIRSDGKNYAEVDTTIAMDHLILKAADLGLGTCWIAAFDPVVTRNMLKLPTGVDPLVLTPLGYPADEPRAKKRKSMTELVMYDQWVS